MSSTAKHPLSALIFHPNPSKRQYLWQAVLADPNFEDVKAVKDAKELIDHLAYSKPYDLILVSTDVEVSKRDTIVAEGRKRRGGKDAAYVVVVGGDSKDTSSVASEMTGDYNGILLEPYSASNLKKVAEAAKKFKGELLVARKRQGVYTQLEEITRSLDSVALEIFMGEDHRRSMRLLKNTCKRLPDTVNNVKEVYFDILTEICMGAAPRTFERSNIDDKYKGASTRVKKKIQAKIQESDTKEEE